MFDDLARRLADAVPPGVQGLQKDLEKNFRTIVQSTMAKFDLVTREEFDVQTQVLARTRQKVEVLEHKVAQLEQLFAEKNNNQNG